MRYNPATESMARDIDVLAAECREAIADSPDWIKLRQHHLEGYHVGLPIDYRWLAFLDLSIALDMAKAMGDTERVAMLRDRLISGIFYTSV